MIDSGKWKTIIGNQEKRENGLKVIGIAFARIKRSQPETQ